MKGINKIFIVFAVVATIALASCEDVINPDLEQANAELVVEAWLNNKPVDQVIYLTRTQPYFDNTLPTGVSGAVVKVEDSEGEVMNFLEDSKNKGSYRWSPLTPGETFGAIGREYKLSVVLNGETFESVSYMGPVPELDSISFRFEESSSFYPENSYTSEFWARDLPGSGDTYWIRTYKNDTLLNKPSEISLAFDAGFSQGGNFDGVEFIPPIRSSINPNNEDKDGNVLSPYLPGDSVYVEIHSITYATFTYLNEVVIQTDRPGGFGELFASPLSNVSTNIANVNPKGSKVVGFFNVAAVSGLGRKLKVK
jgi:hypothetical protein